MRRLAWFANTAVAGLVAATLAFFSSGSSAALLPYALVLDVTHIGNFAPCDQQNILLHRAPCDLSVGDTFVGHFKVDESLLAMEGNNLIAQIHDFFLQIGTVVWDQNYPSDFASFRGPASGTPGGFTLVGPGFDVHGGVLTGLRGGVLSFGDAPFVDFPTAFQPGIPPGTFSSVITGAFFTGDLTVLQISEPPALALFALGGFLGFVMSRRKTVPLISSLDRYKPWPRPTSSRLRRSRGCLRRAEGV